MHSRTVSDAYYATLKLVSIWWAKFFLIWRDLLDMRI